MQLLFTLHSKTCFEEFFIQASYIGCNSLLLNCAYLQPKSGIHLILIGYKLSKGYSGFILFQTELKVSAKGRTSELSSEQSL